MNDKQVVEKLIALAVRVGKIVQNCRKKGLTIGTKSSIYDFCTDADIKCQKVIVDFLQKEFPHDSIVGEENCTIVDNPKRIWLIDPIDGTKCFKDGGDGYCIMIGLVVDKKPHLGVVHAPDQKVTYYGISGKGSFERRNGVDNRLHVNSRKDMKDATFLTPYRTDNKEVRKEDVLLDSFPETIKVPVGAYGLKACLIASGAADFQIHLTTNGGKWDTCAPEVILVEAGGKATGYGGGPIEYDGDLTTLKDSIVCSNKLLHSEILKRIKDAGWELGPKIKK